MLARSKQIADLGTPSAPVLAGVRGPLPGLENTAHFRVAPLNRRLVVIVPRGVRHASRMGPDAILVSLYDMASYDMPGVVVPTMDEVVADITRAGFQCDPQTAFGPAEGKPSTSFVCSAASLDVFDLLSVLVPSRIVFTAIARGTGSLSVYVGLYGGDPLEILEVPLALVDTALSRAEGLSLLEAWVKTRPYTDTDPSSIRWPKVIVALVLDAWAGTLNTKRLAPPAEVLDGLSADIAEDSANWADAEWVKVRRDRRVAPVSNDNIQTETS